MIDSPTPTNTVDDWDTSRTGEPWTGMDLHTARRNDLTGVQRSRLLKRTYNAVMTKRSELNTVER
jgi:hypothetical protein